MRLRRPSPREWYYAVRWQAFGHEAKIATAVAFGGLAALVAGFPRWTLDYLHVLAWPAVVLIAIVLFRVPIHALLSESALEEGGVGPLNFRFRQRQDQQTFAALIEANEAVEGLQGEVEVSRQYLEVAGALLQIYEVQIGFIRHVQTSEEPVTASAADRWFEEQTRAAVEAGAALDIPALTGWLVNRDLIRLTLRGAYELTEKGQLLLSVADNFWYVAKVL